MIQRLPILILVPALLGACTTTKKKKETVEVELASVEPVQVEGELGVSLKVLRRQTIAYLEVIERSPNAKSVTRITDNEKRKLQIGPPIPSPVGRELVYQIIQKDEKDGILHDYSNIWRQKIGSYARTRVTFGKSLDVEPVYTRDGKRIVYASNSISRKLRLFSVRVGGGGGKTMVTRTEAEDYKPSSSPDGKTVAYTSLPPNAEEPQLWTIDMTTGLPTQLREGSNPHVSPDGKRILYSRPEEVGKGHANPDDQILQIWRIDMDGGQETQMTQNTKYTCTGPRWSPDGKWIVFASDQGKDTAGDMNFDLWLMPAGGGAPTQITTNGSHDDSPRWSHDGKSIYFRSNRGGQWNIWRLTPILP